MTYINEWKSSQVISLTFLKSMTNRSFLNRGFLTAKTGELWGLTQSFRIAPNASSLSICLLMK